MQLNDHKPKIKMLLGLHFHKLTSKVFFQSTEEAIIAYLLLWTSFADRDGCRKPKWSCNEDLPCKSTNDDRYDDFELSIKSSK